MSDTKDINEVLDAYNKKREIEDTDEEYSEENKEIIENIGEIVSLEISDGEKEKHVFKRGESFNCEVVLKEKGEKAKIGFSFLEKKRNKFLFTVHTKDITEGDGNFKVNFNVDRLPIPVSPYLLSFYVDGEELVSGLMLEVMEEGDKVFGDRILWAEGEEDFPEGKFYALGDVENIVEEFNNAEKCVSVFSNPNSMLLQKAKETYEKGRIIGSD